MTFIIRQYLSQYFALLVLLEFERARCKCGAHATLRRGVFCPLGWGLASDRPQLAHCTQSSMPGRLDGFRIRSLRCFRTKYLNGIR